MSDETIMKVQEALAHQDQSINDLSDMLIQQGNEIVRLNSKIEKLEAKLNDAQGSGSNDFGAQANPADQKPPHY